MKNEMKEFLAEGLKHYKQASYIMTEFFRNTQGELRGILERRNKWGSVFEPKEAIKIKSTKYWDEYPFINAFKEGTIEGKTARIGIAINWYQSKSEYPIYGVWLEVGPGEKVQNIRAYIKKGRFELAERNAGLNMEPNPEDFDLERDFNLLIDEFVRIL